MGLCGVGTPEKKLRSGSGSRFPGINHFLWDADFSLFINLYKPIFHGSFRRVSFKICFLVAWKFSMGLDGFECGAFPCFFNLVGNGEKFTFESGPPRRGGVGASFSDLRGSASRFLWECIGPSIQQGFIEFGYAMPDFIKAKFYSRFILGAISEA